MQLQAHKSFSMLCKRENKGILSEGAAPIFHHPARRGKAMVAGGRAFPKGLQKGRVFLVTYMAVANLTG